MGKEQNNHLLTNHYLDHAQPLLELIADYGMVMALLKDNPTLEASATKNWTHPDNFFCTETTIGSLTHCFTDPTHHGPCTDHVPILMTLELQLPQANNRPTRNFNDVDWKKFNKSLMAALIPFPTTNPIVTEAEFQHTTKGITKAVLSAIEEYIPYTCPSPHSKHWWTKELSQLQKETNKLASLSFKMRAIADHLSHETYLRQRNRYTEAIKQTKRDHWDNWLESINREEIWIANKYLNSEPSDGSPARIPTLEFKHRDGSLGTASANDEKSRILATTFFPPPPSAPSAPDGYEYPEAISEPDQIMKEQIEQCIKKLRPMKVPGPDGITNIVFKKCTNILVPQMLRLFRAVFLLSTYHDSWREFPTIVLHKPGKPNYSVPKAYRPIALLNTTGKLLMSVIADQLTHILETNNLLPATHFGGRPGRSTTDSLHLFEATVKNTWRAGKVVSALFLDIEGAFPNAVTDCLLHNMRKRRILTPSLTSRKEYSPAAIQNFHSTDSSPTGS